MSNSLDPDQAWRIVGPDLGPNCLLRFSADNSGRLGVTTCFHLRCGLSGLKKRQGAYLMVFDDKR